MKKILILSLLSSCLFFACKETTESSVEQEIVPEEAVVVEEFDILSNKITTAHLALVPKLFKLKLDATENVVLLDIRTPEELAENGTIDGAVNVDYYAANFQEEIEKLDREVPVMLYCRSGGRSGEAAALLKDLGFKQVFDMQGGYNAWLEEDFKENN